MSIKKVGDLRDAPYNPRKITQSESDRLAKMMAEFGDLSGIVSNRRTGHLVGGHMRIRHFDPDWPIQAQEVTDNVGTIRMGFIMTPTGNWSYREVDWPESKEILANIAANKGGGSFDNGKLKMLFAELDTGEFDMDLTGFSGDERTDLFGDTAAPSPNEKKAEHCPRCNQPIPWSKRNK